MAGHSQHRLGSGLASPWPPLGKTFVLYWRIVLVSVGSHQES
jgi:hypothetical protein